jgi:hypothetical protein
MSRISSEKTSHTLGFLPDSRGDHRDPSVRGGEVADHHVRSAAAGVLAGHRQTRAAHFRAGRDVELHAIDRNAIDHLAPEVQQVEVHDQRLDHQERRHIHAAVMPHGQRFGPEAQWEEGEAGVAELDRALEGRREPRHDGLVNAGFELAAGDGRGHEDDQRRQSRRDEEAAW